jgi:cytochrome c5
VRHFLVALVAVAACGTEPSGGDDTSATPPYPEVPAEAQRPGDPMKGYDYLINGGYITCGLPKSIAPGGNAADRMPGRRGDNANLPYYFSAADSPEGVRVVSANCLMCHAGRINGQLVVGLGAADRDFTADQVGLIDLAGGLLSDPKEIAAWQRFRDRTAAIADYSRTLTIGTNPADSFTAALMAHRDPATLAWSPQPLLPLPPPIVVPVDVPPWWRMSKKHAMFYNASGRGDHARIMMAAALLCSDTVAEAQVIDQAFVDVRAWIETAIEPPKWPWAVDASLAGAGKTVFEATCAKCHGTYGAGGSYPNQLVPLADIGTDALLAQGETEFAERFVAWFAQSFWGELSRLQPTAGYMAPPLDGIWATAPYFHNGSVPTIEAVLDPTKRPRFWTRTFQSTDYDQAKLGWKHTVLDHGHAGEPTAGARVKIYDTTQTGYGNEGHLFAADLAESERVALLEYLKTL